MKTKGYFFGCLSSITYGLIPLFAIPLLKGGMRYDSLLLYRFFFAAILLAIILIIKKESFKIKKNEIKSVVLLGLLFALSSQFFFWSYSFLSISIASTLLFLYPIFVAILMNVIYKEKISLFSILAISLAFIGILVLSKSDTDETINPIGLILIFCAALGYALYLIVLNKSHAQNMSPNKLTFYALSVSCLFFLVREILFGDIQILESSVDYFRIISLSLFPTVISCVAMAVSVRYIGATSTAVLGALEPVTAVAVGVFVFHELFTINLALGVSCIIIAVSMIILSDKLAPKLKLHHKKRIH